MTAIYVSKRATVSLKLEIERKPCENQKKTQPIRRMGIPFIPLWTVKAQENNSEYTVYTDSTVIMPSVVGVLSRKR